MASKLDTIVKAQRFNDLKSRVKNECKRRKYIGSVEAYGDDSWDFINTPTTNTIAEDEQYRRITIPIKKINWKSAPNGPYDRIINDADLLTMETKIAAFETRSITTTTATDCSSLCTGTCTQYCTTGCKGDCTGTCSGCTKTCRDDCTNSCEGGCKGCTNTCREDCETACGIGCVGGCFTQCAAVDTCSANCSSACSGGCGNICGAGACGNNCKTY